MQLVITDTITKTFGAAIHGIKADLISIEVNIIQGTKLYIIGLADNAIKESQHRIESVLKSIGKNMPRKRVIVSLAPADLKKEGAAYDLPIALAILQCSKQYLFEDLDKYIIMGELALDGKLRPIKGILPIAIEAKKNGFKGFILPRKNAKEASIVGNLDIIPVDHISDAISFLTKQKNIVPLRTTENEIFEEKITEYDIDFADVQGQNNVKKALEVAAAGGHNVIMIGPPGAGKTLLAKRIVTILPPLNMSEALETTKIYSVSGKLNSKESIILKRPFRSPHHTISDTALVGGGTIPHPGELSLAHNGVLFLDELPEFKRNVLEVMRQPLEDKKVTISRAKMSIDFPTNFMLIASMNPCPCGFYNHPTKECACSSNFVSRYLNKISGPLLDRIDIHLEVIPVNFETMISQNTNESSKSIKERVIIARQIQNERFKNFENIYCNAMMPPSISRKICLISEKAKTLLKIAMEKLKLSARAYDKILKLSRTIADLDGMEKIEENHIAQAISYRNLDRENWWGQ